LTLVTSCLLDVSILPQGAVWTGLRQIVSADRSIGFAYYEEPY
jgi:hypothetical protein